MDKQVTKELLRLANSYEYAIELLQDVHVILCMPENNIDYETLSNVEEFLEHVGADYWNTED